MSDLAIRLFGPFEIEYNGEPLTHFRTSKTQALLVYLLVEAHTAHQREALMTMLWPDLSPESAQTNLRQVVYQLRKAIPATPGRHNGRRVPFLLSDRQTVQVNPDADYAVDVADFAAATSAIRAHAHSDILTCATCRERLAHAADLHRGDFLAGFYLEDSNAFEEWAARRRETYRRAAGHALHTLAAAAMLRGDHEQAQVFARRQLDLDGLDERAYRQLMEALARAGQRSGALAVYEGAARTLREELGVGPSAQTARLAEQIRRDELGVEQPRRTAVRGYTLLDEIGAGAFGVVHRAFQPGVNREVAVKIINERYANHPDFIRRFEAEAQTIARLEHPHIVPLYDYWREPDNAYLVMRWLRGGSLADLLERGPLPPDRAAAVIGQLSAALFAAHRRRVIHGDVKPANILLDEEGNAYLSDFNVARDNSVSPLVDWAGSLDYATPEQLLGEELSPQTDQYGLGLVIYRMLTGRSPFAVDTPEEARRLILEEALPPVAQDAAAVPTSAVATSAVDAVIRRATARDPRDRFADVTALAAAFHKAISAAPAAGTMAEPALMSEARAFPNPYMGLRAFQETDAAAFFGREALVGQLLARLDRPGEDGRTPRFLAVVGPSGSGKSSAVKAGLIPALRAGGVDGSAGWFVAEMTPGSHPLEELERALLRVVVDPPDSLLDALQADERGLDRALRRLLPQDADGEPPQLLLVIDQFEELFTLVDETPRERFVGAMLAALAAPDSRLRVVATLRADFYDRPLQSTGLGELLRQGTEVVLPLSPAELERSITRPAAPAGAVPEPALLAVMLADVADQPGSLPLLQYALTELYDRREAGQMTLAAYRAIGGVAGALGRRADEIYDALDPAGQEAARQMFLRLVTLGEGVEDTRRRVLRSELEALDMADDGRQTTDDGKNVPLSVVRGPWSVVLPLDAYGRARLLTFDRDPLTRGPTVEVAHEALLREWPRLRGWLDESRADVRLQRLLAGETAEWLAAGRGDGYLLRGSRLDQFEEWLAAPKVSLTPDESAFLAASTAARNRRRADEEARRQRELDTARQLAETERRRAEEQAGANVRLRRRAALLAGALALAGLLAVAAFGFARSSGSNAAVAATRAAEANANAALAVENANLASTRQAEAVTEANQRATAEAEAVIEADQRATAEAEANTQRDTALSREREALESYSLSLAANARQALADHDQQLALLLALAANTVENPPLDAWRTLLDVAYAPGAMRSYEAGSPVLSIDISPDDATMLTGAADGRVRLWDVVSGELLLEMHGHSGAVNVVEFSPDGQLALSGSSDQTAIIWDLATGGILHRLESHNYQVTAGAFLPNGRQVITGDSPDYLPGEIILWDISSGEMVRRFGADQAEVFESINDIAISPDGETALVAYTHDSAFAAKPIALWDINSEEIVRYLEGTTIAINSVAISPDGRLGFGSSDDTNVYVWELATGRLLQTLRGHSGFATSVAVSPDNISAFTGSLDGTVILWDLATGEPIYSFSAHTDTIWAVDFIDVATAVSTSEDGTIRLWDLTGRWQLERWREPGNTDNHLVSTLEIDPVGRYVLAATYDKDTGGNPTLLLWDYETGSMIRRMQNDGAYVTDGAFVPHSSQLLAGLENGAIAAFDIATGEEVYRLEGHIETITSVAVSSDGLLAASGSYDGEVMIWDLGTRRMLHRMNGHIVHFPISDVRFLPGNRQVVSSGGDGTIVLWDVKTGAQIKRLTGLEGDAGGHLIAEGLQTGSTPQVNELSITPGGELLSTGEDGTLLLWDLVSGHSIRRFTGHSQSVRSVALTPDGRLALSGAYNNPMILWNVATGKPIRHFPFRSISSGDFYPFVVIHPDGRTALTSDIDGSIIKWQLAEPDPTELIDWIATNRVLRELSCLERETYRIDPPCIDGVSDDSVVDMLASVRQATASHRTNEIANGETKFIEPLELIPPAHDPMPLVLGENRGELVRGDYDVWTYEGEAGDVIGLHMIADHPLTDWTLPLDKRYEAGILDTELQILSPNGRSWNLSKDETTTDLRRLSDARIIGFRLPEDGVYQIEARSALDDHAGPYTLVVELLPAIWYQDIFEEYTGHYLDGPWQWHVMIYIEDGRLFNTYPYNGGGADEWIPLSQSEFATGGSSITRMLRDENGAVSGYEVLYGFEHAIGGHWYKGVRVGDLPPEFIEFLAEDIR